MQVSIAHWWIVRDTHKNQEVLNKYVNMAVK